MWLTSPQTHGAPAKSFRMALGALIIKQKLGISDRPRVKQILENPYLQYFIGQSNYSNELAFDPSLLVHFRQKFSPNLINKVNERMVEKMREITLVKPEKKKGFGRQKSVTQSRKIDRRCNLRPSRY
jgi:hypothetical protein